MPEYGIANRNDNTKRRGVVLYPTARGERKEERKKKRERDPRQRRCRGSRGKTTWIRTTAARCMQGAKLRQEVRMEFSPTVREKLYANYFSRAHSKPPRYFPDGGANRSLAFVSNYCVYSPCKIDQYRGYGGSRNFAIRSRRNSRGAEQRRRLSVLCVTVTPSY